VPLTRRYRASIEGFDLIEDGFSNCAGGGFLKPAESREFENPKCKCADAHWLVIEIIITGISPTNEEGHGAASLASVAKGVLLRHDKYPAG
jgi:hypothetical protein